MPKSAEILAAAWKAWAVWQETKDDQSARGQQKVWNAILEMFRIMDGI